MHKASFYDPELNRSYGAMAAHYGIGILPARPYHPKDKAKVEAGVRIAQFYLLGRLRKLKFFSLAECNAAITKILVQLNGRVMRRLGVSRRELFETVERPAMRPLPDTDHEYADWALARVGIDYHVEVAGFFYSVPYSLIRQQVETRSNSIGETTAHRNMVGRTLSSRRSNRSLATRRSNRSSIDVASIIAWFSALIPAAMQSANSAPNWRVTRLISHELRGLTQVMSAGSIPYHSNHWQVSIAVLPAPIITYRAQRCRIFGNSFGGTHRISGTTW